MRMDEMTSAEAKAAFLECCHSERYSEEMVKLRPFRNKEALLSSSDTVWFSLDRHDWLEAFSSHQRIGDLGKKASRGAREQKSMAQADETVLEEFKALNEKYENKFGFIFLIHASGKSPKEMLSALKNRINNDTDEEIKNASIEQSRITKNRLMDYL